MFEHNSRYEDVETDTYEKADGTPVKYVKRRIIPASEDDAQRDAIRMEEQDRLDHVAHRAFGDPKQYWRLCDANRIMNPRTISENGDRILSVSTAGAGGSG